MTIKDFTVGQTAYIYSNDRGKKKVKEVTVTKIGRVYVTIDDLWEPKFSVPGYGEQEYLLKKSDYGGEQLLFRTRQDVDDYLEKNRLFAELLRTFDYSSVFRFTLSQLRAIKRIIDGEETT